MHKHIIKLFLSVLFTLSTYAYDNDFTVKKNPFNGNKEIYDGRGQKQYEFKQNPFNGNTEVYDGRGQKKGEYQKNPFNGNVEFKSW